MAQEIIKNEDGTITVKTITEETVNLKEMQDLILSLNAGIVVLQEKSASLTNSTKNLPDFIVSIIQKEIDVVNEEIIQKRDEVKLLENRLSQYGEII